MPCWLIFTYGQWVEQARQQDQRGGQVAGQEVVVEQAEAEHPLLPLHGEEPVPELERVAGTATVLRTGQDGAYRSRSAAANRRRQTRQRAPRPRRVRSAAWPPTTRTASNRNSGNTSQGGRVAKPSADEQPRQHRLARRPAMPTRSRSTASRPTICAVNQTCPIDRAEVVDRADAEHRGQPQVVDFGAARQPAARAGRAAAETAASG